MTQEQYRHPITPPPHVIHNWCQELKINGDRVDLLLIKAAQWGSDQELEACCEWLKAKHYIDPDFVNEFRTDRRPPQPPETIEVDGFTYKLIR